MKLVDERALVDRIVAAPVPETGLEALRQVWDVALLWLVKAVAAVRGK